MVSLYDCGWRQGTIFQADLPLDAVVIGSSGVPDRFADRHDRWVIATQDCDLARADSDASGPCIELRPVYVVDPPTDWGIRSARLRLTDTDYIVSASSRPIVAPAVLSFLLAGGLELCTVDKARRVALTTWLGLRYDRPAVPTHLGALARRISEAVASRKHRTTGAVVRDVLIQFDDEQNPVRFSLFAILDDTGDENEVRSWLGTIAITIPIELGIADQIEVGTSDQIAFSVIETSYAADVSQVTWRPGTPDPEGAK